MENYLEHPAPWSSPSVKPSVLLAIFCSLPACLPACLLACLLCLLCLSKVVMSWTGDHEPGGPEGGEGRGISLGRHCYGIIFINREGRAGDGVSHGVVVLINLV